jgi:hypothetical protein
MYLLIFLLICRWYILSYMPRVAQHELEDVVGIYADAQASVVVQELGPYHYFTWRNRGKVCVKL